MGGKPRVQPPWSADWEPYLARLEALPFVRGVALRNDSVLCRLSTDTQRFRATSVRGALGYARVNSLIAQLSNDPPWILFAPYVSAGIAEHIVRHGGNFVDLAGNYSVSIGDQYLFHVQGKRPTVQATVHKALRGPGLQVLLALLVDPDLATKPVRELASRAGASKSTVANVLGQLREEGTLTVSTKPVQLDDRLWDRFATGYASSLRPSWMYGRYRAQERDVSKREERLAELLGDDRVWAWGGGAAADRLTGYYHGPMSVLHLAEIPERLVRDLRLLRAEDGDIVLLRTPCPAAFDGRQPHVAARPLVYAELVSSLDDRAIKTAAMVRSEGS